MFASQLLFLFDMYLRNSNLILFVWLSTQGWYSLLFFVSLPFIYFK
jgi:hypothetical protein